MHMLDKGKEVGMTRSMDDNATNNSSPMQMCEPSWIIDSRATDHMTNYLKLLNNLNTLHDPMKNNVHLPNGKTMVLKDQGKCNISCDHTIDSVLYVPDFNYNLMSISKMTREFQCSVLFFPTFVFFRTYILEK